MAHVSPLNETTSRDGAHPGEESGWLVPACFGDLDRELDACRATCGVADVSHWGTIAVSGSNAVKFLQGLVTNDVARLSAGDGCYAAFLNVHGRIESDVAVFAFDGRLVLRVPPETTGWVESNLGRFRLAGGFDVTSGRDTLAAIAVIGPDSGAMLERVVGAACPPASGCASVTWESGELFLLGSRRAASTCVDVVAPVAAIRLLWERLVQAGAVPVGAETLETIRLEAAIPRFGRDFDADTVLQEIDVPEIVSYQKGCYLGQEIVARLHFQGQPGKLLRRLRIPGDAVPEPGDEVVSDDDPGRVAGRVTSVGSRTAGGPTVLAMIKRRFYDPGTCVRIRRGDTVLEAVVAERFEAATSRGA